MNNFCLLICLHSFCSVSNNDLEKSSILCKCSSESAIRTMSSAKCKHIYNQWTMNLYCKIVGDMLFPCYTP